MDRKMILVLLAILLSSSIPVLAATLEWTTTLLYFNVGAANEIRVTLLGQPFTVTEAGGNATAQNIEFNSSGPTQAWVNARVTGLGSTQNDDNAIITISNPGSTNPEINISVNSSQSGCIDLHYFMNQTASAKYSAGTPASETQLNTTNVTLDGSFAPQGGEPDIGLWLWGNFSGCAVGNSKVEMLYVFANFP